MNVENMLKNKCLTLMTILMMLFVNIQQSEGFEKKILQNQLSPSIQPEYLQINNEELQILSQFSGKLSNKTILSLARRYHVNAGMHMHIKEINQMILEKNNNVTIYQFYATESEADIENAKKVTQIGTSRLIEIPILVPETGFRKYDIRINEKSFFNRRYLRYFSRHVLNLMNRYPQVFIRVPYFKNKYYEVHENYEEFLEKVRSLTKSLENENSKIDLFISHSPDFIETFLFSKEMKKRNIPFVLQNHVTNSFYETRGLARLNASFADKVMGYTNQLVPERLKHKFQATFNGVDIANFNMIGKEKDLSPIVENGIQRRPLKLLLVARMVPGKGHLDVLKVAQRLKEKYNISDIEISFIGPNVSIEEKEHLRRVAEFAKSIGLSESVRIVGNVNPEELKEEFLKADIFTFPSSFPEGFGRVVAEAQAMRTPVIVYRVGGVPGALEDNYSGYILEQGDVEGFSEKVFGIATNTKLRESLGKNGESLVYDRFTPEKFYLNYERVFLELLENTDYDESEYFLLGLKSA